MLLLIWHPFSSLKSGDIIKKGFWGRVILDRPKNSDHSLRELIYEEVRKEYYPEKPSRLNCVFLCPNKESAFKFGGANRKNHSLYAVEIIDEDAKRCTSNYDAMPNMTISSYEDVKNYAHDYWKGIDIPEDCKELLVESDVRVLQKVL